MDAEAFFGKHKVADLHGVSMQDKGMKAEKAVLTRFGYLRLLGGYSIAGLLSNRIQVEDQNLVGWVITAGEVPRPWEWPYQIKQIKMHAP